MTSQRADTNPFGLEVKYARLEAEAQTGGQCRISGYASLFDLPDQSGDIVQKGAYAKSLARLAAAKSQIKMLWQHDPASPIGVWDEVREDARGLFVAGRILDNVEKGREARALVMAGAIDGLSIGYRTIRATRNDKGQRLLAEVDLWEVSLVTFPMLPQARVDARKQDQRDDLDADAEALRELAALLTKARLQLAGADAR